MSLVTVDDVRVYLDRDMSASEEQAASVVFIPGVESSLVALGRPVTPTTFTERVAGRYNAADGTTHIRPSHTPILSVVSITGTAGNISLDGVNIAGAGSRIEMSAPLAPTFGSPLSDVYVTVTYTAGLDDESIRALKFVVLARIGRLMNARHEKAVGVTSIDVEGYRAVFTVDDWTPAEKRVLSRFVRRRTA